MNTFRKQFAHILIVAVIAAGTVNVTLADDLNAPAYRNDPLSVHGHWQNIDGTANLTLVDFWSVEDSDPDTFLDTLLPATDYVEMLPNHEYKFFLPNFIDKMPVKYMRLQLAWTGDATPATILSIGGVDGINPVPGNVVFDSPVTATPIGFYQYFDIEFYPNPDSERWSVQLPDTNYLVQAVADTVSTVPEPATLSILALGGLLLRKRK
jgi:hypothetical protein